MPHSCLKFYYLFYYVLYTFYGLFHHHCFIGLEVERDKFLNLVVKNPALFLHAFSCSNATCKIVKVLGSPYGSGGAGAQTGSDVIHKAAIAILNFLTVAAFTLLL